MRVTKSERRERVKEYRIYLDITLLKSYNRVCIQLAHKILRESKISVQTEVAPESRGNGASPLVQETRP